MEKISRGMRNTLRYLAALYLLLNLCVASIPRCDSVLTVLQHTLKQQKLASLTHHDTACHDQGTLPVSAIGADKICECSLVQFVFVTLSHFDPQRFIAFRIQTITLIQFENSLWKSAFELEPEPPYPRSILPVPV